MLSFATRSMPVRKPKSQMWIILQAAGKEITHEIHDFRIKNCNDVPAGSVYRIHQ